ncbi:MAG: hypothetical protein CMJ41_03480 [Phycisphaerae bacterium]|nr:hypothetical protein [Phycisphaerae bacterium]
MVSRVSSTLRLRAFTLIELLAVIVIVSIVSVVTLVAYRALVSDSRHSVAANTVSTALDNARALAIEQRKRTMVVFRPVRTGTESQQIAVVIAVETGDIHLNEYAYYELEFSVYSGQTESQMGLRFEPAKGVKPRLLPEGMMIAAPASNIARAREGAVLESDTWLSQSNLARMKGTDSDESPGVVLGIFFEPDGSMRQTFQDTGSSLAFVDFNGDRAQRVVDPGAIGQNPYRDWCLTDACRPTVSGGTAGVPEPGQDYDTTLGLTEVAYNSDGDDTIEEGTLLYYGLDRDESEPYVLVAPFFAIFDYQEAADYYGGHLPDPDLDDQIRWVDATARTGDLSRFAKTNGHVYYFNKFSGTVTK